MKCQSCDLSNSTVRISSKPCVSRGLERESRRPSHILTLTTADNSSNLDADWCKLRHGFLNYFVHVHAISTASKKQTRILLYFEYRCRFRTQASAEQIQTACADRTTIFILESISAKYTGTQVHDAVIGSSMARNAFNGGWLSWVLVCLTHSGQKLFYAEVFDRISNRVMTAPEPSTSTACWCREIWNYFDSLWEANTASSRFVTISAATATASRWTQHSARVCRSWLATILSASRGLAGILPTVMGP